MYLKEGKKTKSSKTEKKGIIGITAGIGVKKRKKRRTAQCHLAKTDIE